MQALHQSHQPRIISAAYFSRCRDGRSQAVTTCTPTPSTVITLYVSAQQTATWEDLGCSRRLKIYPGTVGLRVLRRRGASVSWTEFVVFTPRNQKRANTRGWRLTAVGTRPRVVDRKLIGRESYCWACPGIFRPALKCMTSDPRCRWFSILKLSSGSSAERFVDSINSCALGL